VKPVVAAIRAAAQENGRVIDDDHYGAGFAFRFGSADETVVQRTAAGYSRLPDVGDPMSYFAVGSAKDIASRVNEYIEAGVSKFVLRPIADSDEEILAQTQRLTEEVIPRFAGNRAAVTSAAG
jgi:hypothetical protein